MTHRPRRTNAEVLDECGTSSKIFNRPIDGGTGEVRKAYKGTVPKSRDELQALYPDKVIVPHEDGREVTQLVGIDADQVLQDLKDPARMAQRGPITGSGSAIFSTTARSCTPSIPLRPSG
jgi:hypothetical protein